MLGVHTVIRAHMLERQTYDMLERDVHWHRPKSVRDGMCRWASTRFRP